MPGSAVNERKTIAKKPLIPFVRAGAPTSLGATESAHSHSHLKKLNKQRAAKFPAEQKLNRTYSKMTRSLIHFANKSKQQRFDKHESLFFFFLFSLCKKKGNKKLVNFQVQDAHHLTSTLPFSFLHRISSLHAQTPLNQISIFLVLFFLICC